jgi:hypothetical protein
MGDAELLDFGEDRRWRLSGRLQVSLLVLVPVVVCLGYGVDRSLRGREAAAVASCAAGATEAVDLASRRVQATYEYVRPAFGSASTPGLRAGLFQLVAESAAGAGGRLDAPAQSCRDVSVIALHRDLSDRRDRCVRLLDAQRDGLQALAADGETLQEWMQLPRAC